MRTVREVSKLAGVSVRTLHHYDQIGLLRPSARSEAGYRLYDDADLLRLQHIMLFRELEFPLADIRRILDSPAFDQARALQQQIELLELRREHISDLIGLAKDLQAKGVGAMSFEAFDTSKLDAYAATLLPCVYEDFFRAAQSAVHGAIAEKLRKALTFTFQDEGRLRYPPERVALMEKQIRKRAALILKH